jgi:superfamily II DNA or RNA helicase
MTSNFFNNTDGNTLFAKFRGIAEGMADFHTFQAVSGFFRSSGWFKLRKELERAKTIQVLVGIDLDDVFRRRDRSALFLGAATEEARRRYAAAFADDIREAGYSGDIERGILQFCEDIASGHLEIRIHPSKNLHAKFYLCLPEHHTEHAVGWVIMGSSNLSDSGLGTTSAPRYELNVSMTRYEDVAYCRGEFARLWEEGIPVRPGDVVRARAETHLDRSATPWELWMKILIDAFGDLAEDDFSMDLPPGFLDLKYQRDAVIQGYQMLRRYDGFFLADVVGLGKTVVAAMVAKRFAEANGGRTRILVVHPPAVERNWKDTFRQFQLFRKTSFVSNGSLDKILDPAKATLPDAGEYDLVIVDESHNFCNKSAGRFDDLQRIAKTPRANPGRIPGRRKKVMLLSATPLKNGPEDLKNQMLFFQDERRCTIGGVTSLADYFAPKIAEYKKIQRARRQGGPSGQARIDALYARIQHDLLDKVTVRRTRRNLQNDPDYAADLAKQGIVFPEIAPPDSLQYQLDGGLDALFWDTMQTLWNDVSYARYRAIEFFVPEYAKKYPRAQQIATSLRAVYQTHMVKRLESSFHAFRQSLATFIAITRDTIGMFRQDKVLVIPELDVAAELAKGLTLDEIVEKAIARNRDRYAGRDDLCYPASAFRPDYLPLLERDLAILEDLAAKWAEVRTDPKCDLFLRELSGTFLHRRINKEGRLVIFSESVDTLRYLEERLGRDDVLLVHSGNAKRCRSRIRANFDANIPPDERADDIRILLCSDALAEGVNLHRANVIVNYDTPWNVTRLMQRIGRVNRIGSSAPAIRNFLFYPSDQGNRAIGLYENALLKMQGFHSALGEDAQIFSREEIVKEFRLFDSAVKDETDDLLELMRAVRALHADRPDDYRRIKALPPKCRVVRAAREGASGSVVHLRSSRKSGYYLVEGGRATPVDFLTAAKRMRADESEPGLPLDAAPAHYADVNLALEAFRREAADGHAGVAAPVAGLPVPARGSRSLKTAATFLRKVGRWVGTGALPPGLAPLLKELEEAIAAGSLAHLEFGLRDLAAAFADLGPLLPPDRAPSLENALRALHAKYFGPARPAAPRSPEEETEPLVVLSETFSEDAAP